MQVIEEVTGKKISYGRSKLVVIEYSKEAGIVNGYVSLETPTKSLFFNGVGLRSVLVSSFGEENIAFSNLKGVYIAKDTFPPDKLLIETQVKGYGKFPYTLIKRNYEAVESFNIFENAQQLLEPKDYILSDFFPYTFGLEFETSQGYVPEDICFRDGLIPLRDGSIKGIEYSTVVLNGNKGLGLMEQQFDTLRKYTSFDKECSLHIHIGGFPLEPRAIFNLYQVCKRLEGAFVSILPEYTFHTHAYKANGKDYCKRLPNFRNFNQLYEYFVGRKFYGDFTQGHPNDPERRAKWRIPTRYFSCNFINLLCYRVNKTVEFRFLRPSYNFEKVILWLYIFNAMLQYSDKHMNTMLPSDFSLPHMLEKVYPPEIVDRLRNGIAGLQVVTTNQHNNGDKIGRETGIEDAVFKGNFGIIYK